MISYLWWGNAKNVFCIKETLYKNIKGQANLFATELPEASRPVLAFMYIVHKKPSHIIQFFPAKATKKVFLPPSEVMAKFDASLQSTAPLKWTARNNAVVIPTWLHLAPWNLLPKLRRYFLVVHPSSPCQLYCSLKVQWYFGQTFMLCPSSPVTLQMGQMRFLNTGNVIFPQGPLTKWWMYIVGGDMAHVQSKVYVPS